MRLTSITLLQKITKIRAVKISQLVFFIRYIPKRNHIILPATGPVIRYARTGNTRSRARTGPVLKLVFANKALDAFLFED